MAKREEVQQSDQEAFDAALDLSRDDGGPRPRESDDAKDDQTQVRETAVKEPEQPSVEEKAAEEKEQTPKAKEPEQEEQPPEEGEKAAEPETEEPETDEPTYNLPGGITVKASELAGDSEEMKKLVNKAHQVAHYQSLYEKEKAAREKEAADWQQIRDQWVKDQMTQQPGAERGRETPAPPPAPERPPAAQIRGAFEPYLKTLVEQGRISEDHVAEDGGMISEYLFDQMVLRQSLEQALTAYEERIAELEDRFGPVDENVRTQRVLATEKSVQNEVASTPGYEDFADPVKWGQLKDYVSQIIVNSGTNQDGEPNFQPTFDARTMMRMADSMMGPAMRQALAARQREVAERQARETQQAAGESQGRAARPGTPREREMTPEEMAMDFSGSTTIRNATG
jgi:hypothetical protein